MMVRFTAARAICPSHAAQHRLLPTSPRNTGANAGGQASFALRCAQASRFYTRSWTKGSNARKIRKRWRICAICVRNWGKCRKGRGEGGGVRGGEKTKG